MLAYLDSLSHLSRPMSRIIKSMPYLIATAWKSVKSVACRVQTQLRSGDVGPGRMAGREQPVWDITCHPLPLQIPINKPTNFTPANLHFPHVPHTCHAGCYTSTTRAHYRTVVPVPLGQGRRYVTASAVRRCRSRSSAFADHDTDGGSGRHEHRHDDRGAEDTEIERST